MHSLTHSLTRRCQQGWIDTTYMNEEGTFRLARGNKGTLFIRE
jgi:hypothetical protein